MTKVNLANSFDLECSERDRLRTALQGTLELIRQAQERLCTHLRPDGPDDDHECLNELLAMFDGPRQRAIEAAARSALNTPQTKA